MPAISPIDLLFRGNARAIAAYLIETTDGPALYDCGPATTLPTLKAGLAELGTDLSEIRHIMLSHIHFDLAGAAGPIIREHPHIKLWVSERGAPHMIDPSRLERSARRLYGDEFDSLWGELAPIPEANVHIADGTVNGWEAFPTPGHAIHHVAYFNDGTLLGGDVCGVRIQPETHILPPTPPPDIDIESWHASIAEIRRRSPERLALIHFGITTDAADHLDRLEERLDLWARRVGDGMEADEFVRICRAEFGDAADLYELAGPIEPSWQGLRRYFDKKAEAAQASE